MSDADRDGTLSIPDAEVRSGVTLNENVTREE